MATRHATALYLGITRTDEWFKIIEDLLEAGADPNKPDGFGNTPLMTAVIGYLGSDFELRVIITLLEAGADPTLPSGSSTPLTEIMYKGPKRDGRALAIMFKARDRELFAPWTDIPDLSVPNASVMED